MDEGWNSRGKKINEVFMVFYGVITLLIIFLAIWYQKIQEKDLVGVKNQYVVRNW